MNLPMKIKRLTRRVKCHVPGCKNRDALKITRRNDVNGNPLFMCEDCLADATKLLEELKAEETKATKVQKTVEAEIEKRTRARATKSAAEAEAKSTEQ